MARDEQRFEWPFPAGGLNLEQDARHIPPTQLVTADNFYYAGPDLLRARGGIDETYTGSANDVGVMYYWEGDDKLYHADNSGALYKNGTAVSGVNSTVKDMVAFEDKLIVVDGTSLYTYDGATYSALTGTDVPSSVKRVMVRHGRLYALGDDNLYYSDVADETKWSGAWEEGGYLPIAAGQDGVCQDWLEYDRAVYVFKDHGVYVFAGDRSANYTVRKVEPCTDYVPGTVADAIYGVLYTCENGIWPVGRKYGGEPHDLTRYVGGNISSSLSSGNATYSPELGCYVLVDGTTTAWLANVSVRPDVWTRLTLPQAASSVYQGHGLWFGGTNGKVYKYDHDAHLDDTSAYTATLKTGESDLGDPLHKKSIAIVEGPYNAAENATVTLSFYVDDDGSATDTKTVTASALEVETLNFNCRRVQVKFAYSSMTGPPQFRGFGLRGRALKGSIV